MPKYRPARSKKFALWDKWGFTPQEAAEFSKVYSVANMRSLPYLIKMARTRRLYTTNLAGKGYGQSEIRRSVGMLYEQKGWADAWAMLRSFRRTAIAEWDYIPPKRSHHGRAGISQQELNHQRKQLEIQRRIDKEVGW